MTSGSASIAMSGSASGSSGVLRTSPPVLHGIIGCLSSAGLDTAVRTELMPIGTGARSPPAVSWGITDRT